MAAKRHRPRAEDFTVGWICALHIELTAAAELLDERYESEEFAGYTLGRIGYHNVAICVCPAGQIGTSPATAAASELYHTFPAIQFSLMVGIGGGVPSAEADVRLGDVVISHPHGQHGGVVQYDFGKTGQNGQLNRTGSLNTPSPILLTAVTRLRADHNVGRTKISEHLQFFERFPKFQRNRLGQDILYESSYNHIPGPTCANCDSEKIVRRFPREDQEVLVHYGTIGSGNQVIKDGLTRDELSDRLGGVLCFEMEAAGLMNTFQCLVIRGICDYADSHKNKVWQPFAAAAAAACAKDILSYLPTSSVGRRSTFPLQRALTLQESGNAVVSNLCDHDDDDDAVQDINGSNSQISRTTRTPLTKDQKQQYMNSLRFDQIEARHATIKAAHTKTCKWLFNRTEYKDWLDDGKLAEHHGFLWIKGKPATGKSTIMKNTLAHTRKTNRDAIIVSFFFNARGDDLEKSTLGMFRSVILQLFEAVPQLQNLFAILRPTTKDDGESSQWNLETLMALFERAIEDIDGRSFICFVDALDECDEGEVRDLVCLFERLGSLAVSLGSQFRTCLSSRHYPSITISDGIELILENQEGHNQDIAIYLQSELKAVHSKHVEKIKEEILERASGIFLWVVLVVRILKEEYDRGRIHTLRQRLKELPDDLDRLFGEILTRDGQGVAELTICLQCVLYAKKPLKPDELYYAILVGSPTEAFVADDFEDVELHVMERFIVTCSKGLTEMTKVKARTVQFIHESVRDFLLKGNGLDNSPIGPARTFEVRSHEQIKQCCLRYLEAVTDTSLAARVGSLNNPWSNGAEEASEIRTKVETAYPLLRYAVLNILYHADEAEGQGFPQKDFIRKFPLAHWVKLSVILQKHKIRQYSPNVSLLYILAELDLPNLIDIELGSVPTMHIVGERYGNPVLAALANGNKRAARALLFPCNVTDVNRLSQLNERFEETLLLLMTAAQGLSAQRDIQLLSKLVSGSDSSEGREKIADRIFDKVSSSHPTVLCGAARSGQKSVVQLLLTTEGINVNMQNSRDSTPLHCAAVYGHESIVRQLLAVEGVDVNLPNHAGWTPLYAAAFYHYESIVRQLLAVEGIDVNLPNNDGWTPLYITAWSNYQSTVRQLLAVEGIDVNIADNRGWTPLYAAALQGHEGTVRQLLAVEGVDVNMADNDGQTPLYTAAWSNHGRIMGQLLAVEGIDVNLPNNEGRTPLYVAAFYGRESIVRQLLAVEGIDVNLPDDRGRTPLYIAATGIHGSIVKLLLDSEAIDVSYQSGDGKTALSAAAERGYDDIVELIQKHQHDKEASRAPTRNNDE